MKTNFLETKVKLKIERGDVLVFKDGRKYLVARVTLSNHPWSLINIETMDELDVYDSFDKIRDKFEEQIVRIIKHNNLEIREVK